MLNTLEEAEAALLDYVPRADSQREKYTLDRMVALMNFLGNPQEKLKVIHVAGTSGKTSTCYFISSLLMAAGLKVGLTVSPHIEKVSERVQINGRPLSDEEFARNLDEFITLTRQSGLKITYFELLMAFAYWYFAKAGVDVAVVETGLGGLLDGSNVVKNPDKTCVITDIGFDHMEVLGRKLKDIAAQKAGIIHSGNQVFMFNQDGEAEAVIKKRCDEVSATLNMLSEQGSQSDLPLFQKHNFSLAEQVVSKWLGLNNFAPLTSDQKNKAAHITVPARMETIGVQGKTVILDGAHNAQKMHAFAESFKSKYPGQTAAVLLAVKAGKDYEELMSEVLPITSRLILTKFAASQDMPFKSVEPDEIVRICENKSFHKVEIIPDTKGALEKLLGSPEELLVITGSLYLAGSIKQFLH